MFPTTNEQLDQQMKNMLTDEAYAIYVANRDNKTKIPMPANHMRKQSVDNSALAEQARTAVSGYSPTNGVRKAVEALADAIENNL